MFFQIGAFGAGPSFHRYHCDIAVTLTNTPNGDGTWGHEARMRAFAIQLLYLLRVHSADAAELEIWVAVEKLESALRSERWPALGEDWKGTGVTQFWEEVTRTVRGARGPRLRRYEVNSAVSAAMKAVHSAREADRNAAKANVVLHRCDDVREVAMAATEAFQIAIDLGTPAQLLEPMRALVPSLPEINTDRRGE